MIVYNSTFKAQSLHFERTIMKKELEIRQKLSDKKAKIDMHKKLIQNGFGFRGNLDQYSYFFDTPQQSLAKEKIKFRIRNSLDDNNQENLLLTLKLKNMQIIDGVREAKEYETWLHKSSNDDLNEINQVLSSFHTPKLSKEIFDVSLGDNLVDYMNKCGYELSEVIKNNRSFYKLGNLEATIDEFNYDEKGNQLTEPQINIEIESNNPEELHKICGKIGLSKSENEQNTWWDACKNRTH